MAPKKEAVPEINYFTCTLGEAAILNADKQHDFETINEFIDLQAQNNPKRRAVCFPNVIVGKLTVWTFTFEALQKGSIAIADALGCFLPVVKDGDKKCVALLCQSSIEFLFMWLGLIRCGYSVLLLAPQCTSAAIAHLCTSSSASYLFFDKLYHDLAWESAHESGGSIFPKTFPWQDADSDVVSFVRSAGTKEFETPRQSGNDVACIFHTSGTSTGLPKPIPQTHGAGVGVLPCLDGCRSATFTTTPLYHGGISDCFRAWTSNALIWLFPAQDMAITSKNIVKCLSIAKKASKRDDLVPAVKYFSCVPYILEMLAEDSDGLKWLKRMDIVGVGGAALPIRVGDILVSKGVNLLSRFGSAECGFLLSSHRIYSKDKWWDYLRVPRDSKYLKFEVQVDGSGLYELIVLKGWAHMAKTNRPGGDFATSDLFKPQFSIDNAWRYHSRSDSQITLITGKKFDPAPVEDALASSSALIHDVFIFGNGRPIPGALVFPSKEGEELTADQMIDAVWKELQKLNIKGQDHTRISKNMVVIMPKGTEPLAKSSKGTVLRGPEEIRFEAEIQSIYTEDEPASTPGNTIPDSDILPLVRKLVQRVIGDAKDLSDDADFYHHGIDSSKATQIRSLIQKELNSKKLPWNVVHDGGNISHLAQCLIHFRNGEATMSKDESVYMLDLVRQCTKSVFDSYEEAPKPEGNEDDSKLTVLLTGATGALGAHILDVLQECRAVDQMFCLVRASTPEKARARVNESLKKRKRAGLQKEGSRVHCLPASLGQENLGLNDVDLERLRSNTNIIIHAAWNVNFSLSLESFVQDHIGGLANLLRFSIHCARPIRFLFCSSTASVLGPSHPKLIHESISSDPTDSDTLGYSKSKWVAEAICDNYAKKQPKGNTIAVLRIGQLTGHSETGVWNMTEAWPLMLSAGRQLECLPDLEEPLSWLPVDVAAQAIVQIAMPSDSQACEGCPVYHLNNNSTETTWGSLLSWLGGWKFVVVSPKAWLECLDDLEEDHPAKALLGLWRNAYGEKTDGPMMRKVAIPPAKEAVCFSTEKIESIAEAMRTVRPIDEGQIQRMSRWLDEELRAKESEQTSSSKGKEVSEID